MSYGRAPGIPRGKLRSHADAEPIPERVYEVLHAFEKQLVDFDQRIGGLEDHAQEGKLADAQILSKLAGLEATDRHATTKLISALVITVITTIGGVMGTVAAMRPGAPPPMPARSALDIRLDTCRPMPPGPSRVECFARVTAETEH